ncbi:MAG: redoxin domain-containing protein, partial [Alphaproteobacteria bacterium]
MRAVWKTTAAAVALMALVGGASISATAADSSKVLPERISDFQLTDTARMAHHLYYFDYAPVIVLMSQTNGSATSRAAAAELAKLQDAYKDKGVLFYMINSNTGDTREATAAEAASNGFKIPVLMDDLQLVGEQLNIQRDGEVFVIDPKASFKLAYHGPLDDRFNAARPNPAAKVKAAYTTQAIDAVLAHRAVATPRVDVKAGRLLSLAGGKDSEYQN